MTLKKDIRTLKGKEVNSKKKFNPASVPIYALESSHDDYGLTKEQYLKVWEHYINTGLVWKMQGWYGRNAQQLLQQGLVKFPKGKTYDYYGNQIPTRAEVKARGGIKTD